MMLNVTFNGASPNKTPILVDEDWWTLYRTPQYYVAAEYYDNGRQLVKNSVRPHMLHTHSGPATQPYPAIPSGTGA